MAWALFVAVRAAHVMPPRAESLPPPPSRWAPRNPVGEQGAAEDDAAIWEWAAPRSVSEAAHSFLHHCRDTALDVYAAFLAFASQLVTVETFGVAAVAVGAVLAFARGFEKGGGSSARHHRPVANLNWAVFASAVVFPLTFALNESWRRRETALQQLAELKANLLSVFLAHADARVAPPPEGHLQLLLGELCVLSRAMEAVLVAPTVSHGRHMLTASGRRHHAAVSCQKRALHTRIAVSLAAISAASSGSGAADASRLVQLLRDATAAWGQLQFIKSYRTPQSARAFSHVAVWVCSILYGPYYAWVAGVNVAGPSAGLGFAIFLAVSTAVALSALLNARYVLEDPFVPGPMDTIRVEKEFELLRHNLRVMAQARGFQGCDPLMEHKSPADVADHAVQVAVPARVDGSAE